MDKRLLSLKITTTSEEARGIKSYRLADATGADLPAFTEGAHIDLHLANGMTRSYSLCNHAAEKQFYEIAVARDARSRGGSIFLLDNLHAGDVVEVSPPRNNFPLNEEAGISVFFAGGIGITPILAMTLRLEALGKPWRLYYAARNREAAAFLERLKPLGDKVRFHFDDEQNRVLDIEQAIGSEPAEAHLYCCGPTPMLQAFERAAATREPEHVHLEYFSPNDAPHDPNTSFSVHLAKSNRTFEIEPGVSILETLLQNGFDIPYSCMEGTCGECEVKVLEGIPEHRDTVLSKKKRAENQVMMICCSRAKTGTLTLDL